nr:MAG TPA: hypothetical protein [Caudoviricetes sp.]
MSKSSLSFITFLRVLFYFQTICFFVSRQKSIVRQHSDLNAFRKGHYRSTFFADKYLPTTRLLYHTHIDNCLSVFRLYNREL